MLFTEIEQRDENGNWEFSRMVPFVFSKKLWERIVDEDDLDYFCRNFIYVGF